SATVNVTTADADLSQFDGIPAVQMGCPNNNWSVRITGLQFTKAVLSAVKDGKVTGSQTTSFQ
ncbi:MAG TPA: hypothetical protein VFX76_20765, partial [Roseiflexaceae bacterium]|nr:hypothetical protein [Roseiflexaceae bacterium]